MFCVYLLDWFEFQREAFMLWHEEESEQTENMEKKNRLKRVNKRQYMPSVLRSKLVIFNNSWTCLVFSQTSG